MEQNQEILLSQMRTSVEKLGTSIEKYGDPTLRRFLIARSMDPEKGAKMFVQWMKWRAQMVPLGFISESQIPEQLEAKKNFLQGSSKSGYPVLVVKASRHFSSKDEVQFKNFLIYSMDRAIASSHKGSEVGNEKFMVIIDMQQVTYKNIDIPGALIAFQMLQDYYPERIAKLYMINFPRFFVGLWKVIPPFLEKATLEKIVMVRKEDEKREMLREIGESSLPKEYGGQAILVHIQDVNVVPFPRDD